MTGWRHGTPQDTASVTAIFNYFINNSWAAYNEVPVTSDWTGRFMTRSRVFYVLEADDRIVGFASLNPFRDAAAFRHTATLTYFLMPQAGGQGRGTQILNRLENDAARLGISQLLAHISSRNEQSLAFHRQRGFHECGRFQQAGRKWKQYFDLIWMQKSLDSSPNEP